jgi:hypothetical protein
MHSRAARPLCELSQPSGFLGLSHLPVSIRLPWLLVRRTLSPRGRTLPRSQIRAGLETVRTQPATSGAPHLSPTCTTIHQKSPRPLRFPSSPSVTTTHQATMQWPSMARRLLFTSPPRHTQASLASPRSTHLPCFHSHSSSLFNAQRSIHFLHSPPVTDQSHHDHQWPLPTSVAYRFPSPTVLTPLAHL